MQFRPVRLVFIAALLPFAANLHAQTVDWWDAVGDSVNDRNENHAGALQVEATSWGIYSVGLTACVEDPIYRHRCKGLLSRYDAAGKLTWRKVIEERDHTWITAVAADETGVYIHGTFQWLGGHPTTDESFIQKYTHEGALTWTFRDSADNPRHYRIANFRAQALLLYDGHLFASTRRSLGNILRKISLDGGLEWLVETPAGALAAGDGRIFVSGGPIIRNRGSDLVAVWDTGGNPVNSFETGELIDENGLAYHDGALYSCMVGLPRSGHATYEVRKMWLDGTTVWSISFGRGQYGTAEGCSVRTDADGVVFAGNLRVKPRYTYPANLTIRRYSFDGDEISRWDFPSLPAVPNSVSLLGEEVYVTGYDFEAGKVFTGHLSGAPLLGPTLARLGTPGGADEHLAVLDHLYGAGRVTALAKPLLPEAGGTFVDFTHGLRPVDVFATDDLNGNGHDELVVLSKEPPVVEIADTQGGAPFLFVALHPAYEPIAATVADDGATPVLAVLMKHRSKGHLQVASFDARTGVARGVVPFNPTFTAIDLFALPSATGLRYAVLAADGSGAGKLEIRHANGTLDQNVWLGRDMPPLRGLIYDDPGGPRIAVLRRNADLGWMDVAVVDPNAGIVGKLPFNPGLVPDAFAWSPDVDMNGAPQFTVAGRDELGKIKAETRDLATGALLHNVFVYREPIEDVLYAGSGTTTPSLALLVRDNRLNEYPSLFRVILVDLLTGKRSGEPYFQF